MTTVARVVLARQGSVAVFRKAYMPAGRSKEYKKAVEGSYYDLDTRRRVASFDRVESIVVRLNQLGIEVRLDEDLQEALGDRRLKTWYELQAAEARIDAIDADIYARKAMRIYAYQRAGVHWLIKRKAGLLADEQGTGKEQPVSEPVLTAHGWVPIGRLEVGEFVQGSRRMVQVVDIFPQGEKAVYRLTLEDGRTVRCGLEHLWEIRTGNGTRSKTKTLREILSAGTELSGIRSWLYNDVKIFLPVFTRLTHTISAYETDPDVPRSLRWVRLERIKRERDEESVCIRVDAPDHLYVTNDFILTHNTLEIIAALPANCPALVVAPASMKYEWLGELQKWRPQLRAQVLHGRASFRWPKAGEILIVNYDILPNVHDTLGRKGRRCDGFFPPAPCPGCKEVLDLASMTMTKRGHLPDCTGFMKERAMCPGCSPLLDQVTKGTVLVGDEVHMVKSPRSQRSVKFRALSAATLRVEEGRVWNATGTPIQNDPWDLWYVAEASGVAEECFGDKEKFKKTFKGKVVDKRRYVWGLPDDDVVEQIQRGCLRRMLREVLPDMPSETWGEIAVDVGPDALRRCDLFMKQFGGIDNLASLIEREKIPFEKMSEVRKALAIAKTPAVLEYLKDFLETYEEPVLVYSMHRYPIDKISKLEGWSAIHGETLLDERRDLVRRFQAGQLKGLALSIRAAGTGLTLTAACRGFFVDMSFNPAENAQAAARMIRIGQKNNIQFKVFKAKHALDERLTEILMRKRALISASVDAASSLGDVRDSDASRDAQAELEAVRREDAETRAARSMAIEGSTGIDTVRVLDALHSLSFSDPGDAAIAQDLAEEASTIGLSIAGWLFAERLVVRGFSKIPAPASGTVAKSGEGYSEDERGDVGDDAEEREIEAMSGEEKIAKAMQLVLAMTDEERGTFLERLDAEVCSVCASKGHTTDACPEAEQPGEDDDDESEGEEDDDEDEDG